MFYLITIIILIVYLSCEVIFLRKYTQEVYQKRQELLVNFENLQRDNHGLREKVDVLERTCQEHFFFYELIRKIAPLLNKDELMKVFSEEIKYLREIEEVEFGALENSSGYIEFKLIDKEPLWIKTKSKNAVGSFPLFVRLLNLCIERIGLYKKMQELSIHDSLTKVYNRRIFMERYGEEFDRAKKFKLNLSFLMIDVDNFKKINDTYGHLVGDVVLRRVAGLIKESIREIDFVARFGGEEFSIILTETDKSGAIMVAERIRETVSKEEIKAFDETLTVNISAGVGSFPQNTSQYDLLIEIADKALYKAKITGRNKVCWF